MGYLFICPRSSKLGVEGYIFLEIGKNLCGIGNFASYPVVTSPPTNPPSWCGAP